MSGAEFEASAKSAAPTPSRRSLARLAAAQALYQIELTGTPPGTVIAEFTTYRLGKEIDGERYADADRRFFTELVGSACERREDIDGMIASALPAEWPLDRLETVLRAILRLGTCELLLRNDVPARVIITEYLEIAHAFFEGKEPGMVNGVLDRIARVLRPQELRGSGNDGGTQAR